MLTEVVENLYLGSDVDVDGFSDYYGVESPIIHYDLTQWRIDYGLTDNEFYRILAMVEQIEKIRDSGLPVIIYCHGGVDRSPFLVACYLYYVQGMKYDEAYELVKEKHPETFIHYDWMHWFVAMVDAMYESYEYSRRLNAEIDENIRRVVVGEPLIGETAEYVAEMAKQVVKHITEKHVDKKEDKVDEGK